MFEQLARLCDDMRDFLDEAPEVSENTDQEVEDMLESMQNTLEEMMVVLERIQ